MVIARWAIDFTNITIGSGVRDTSVWSTVPELNSLASDQPERKKENCHIGIRTTPIEM